MCVFVCVFASVCTKGWVCVMSVCAYFDLLYLVVVVFDFDFVLFCVCVSVYVCACVLVWLLV